MSVPNLTENQKARLSRLEPQLRNAAQKGDLAMAKRLLLDIQGVLRPTGHETRLMQAKNWLFEAAIEAGDYLFAIEGFIGVRKKVNRNTRVYLEATALLAIAYLRKQDLEAAEPLIREVLQNDKVIASQAKRAEFRKAMIARFDEEAILYSMKGSGRELLYGDELGALAEEQAKSHSKEQILILIGHELPLGSLQFMLKVDDFAKRQLPSAERLQLPSPQAQVERDNVGRTFFSAVKRTAYRSLCDPESDIYKAWFNDGLKIPLSKRYVGSAVASAFMGFGIGLKALAVSVCALILKFGIEVFCDRFKPNSILDLRGTRA